MIESKGATLSISTDGKTFTTLEHAQLLRMTVTPQVTPRPLMLGRAKAKR